MDVKQVHLRGLPLPPSVNELHRSVGRGRVIKSEKYRAYEHKCTVWMLQNNYQLLPARAMARECGPAKFLKIDCMFFMLREQIVSLAQLPKPNDTSNRLKAAHDAIAQMLHIDDKYFWCGSFNKIGIPAIGAPPFMDATISLWCVPHGTF